MPPLSCLDRCLRRAQPRDSELATLERSLVAVANDLRLVDAILDTYEAKLAGYECCVCMHNFKEVAMMPCGHIAVCVDCLEGTLQRTARQCPVCQMQVKETARVYL